jgi:hypothetical protein
VTEKVMERRPEPEPQELVFEWMQEFYRVRREQGEKGKVVLRDQEIGWEQNRQGLIKFYSHPKIWHELAVPGWAIFRHHIKKQSGRHTHQGGLGLFVLEGKGYTVVDGVRYDWEEGDFIILPVKPGGCEHQHFNLDPDHPAEWLALIFWPFFDATGNLKKQSGETSPDWQGPAPPPPKIPHAF